MNIFEELFPENLYHSYLIEGDLSLSSLLLSYLKTKKIIEDDTPDLYFENYESLTVSNSHEIKDWHSKLAIGTGKKICIINTKFINKEAEQSLLKMIEEPGVNTHFFIITPNVSVLEETLKSRAHIIKVDSVGEVDIQEIATSFISKKGKVRIDLVASLLKENKTEEGSGKLRHFAISLIKEIEKNIYAKFKQNKKDKANIFILKELEKNKEFLETPGASVKMILEHIALII